MAVELLDDLLPNADVVGAAALLKLSSKGGCVFLVASEHPIVNEDANEPDRVSPLLLPAACLSVLRA